jgi:DNA topoisomerase-1
MKMKKASNLIICESPAKARTLSKIFGREFSIRASYGHVSDLPKSKLGFDPKDNFKAEFNITKDKNKVVSELRSLIDKDTVVYLATDDDREGEAIAYHLMSVLKLKDNVVKRIVFHEITKQAIMEAMANPTKLNYHKADAAIARRILDRAVGYKLSPLLWKKVKYGLSAGRVQSATVKLVVDRENEIKAFIPDEFWKLKLDILSDPAFKAELARINGVKSKVSNATEAETIKANCDSHDYVLDNIVEKDSKRTPPPPFITSTLQQAASSKLGMEPKQTMLVAQKLYEGSISIPNHEGGIITYMRTDSVNLSKVATDAAKELITSEYGKEYALDNPRTYGAKAKGAQEAHEAIRPVNMSIKPSDIAHYLEPREFKLYSLIWSRTMATQMAQAKVANTTYKILGGDSKQYEFTAKGTKILFPGFMKAYDMGNDTDDSDSKEDDEKFLPNVPEGTVFTKTKLTTEQNFTKPPARYTEASLVKKLETEGIGRPSTYATTMATIIAREYVEKDKDKKLVPTMIGTVVNNYLVEHFSNIVDASFTANFETQFDRIESGEIPWQTVMHDFYDDFVKNVEDKEGTDRVQFSEAVNVGKDPETGLDIYVKTGQYGTYIQVGEKSEEEDAPKPKISPVPKGKRAEDITLEDALTYIKLPKVLGETKDGYNIKVAIGRFGPYIQVNRSYYSLKQPVEGEEGGDDPYTIDLPRALEIIKTVDEERAKALLLDFPKEDIKVIIGRYGPYIKSGKKNFKLPKGMEEPEIRKLTLEKVQDIIKNQPIGGKKPKAKK